LAKLPGVGPLVSRASVPLLLEAVKMSQSKLEQINAEARANHDYLTAMLTQFKLDLDQGVTDGLVYKKIS
jgi:hypothetical protein